MKKIDEAIYKMYGYFFIVSFFQPDQDSFFYRMETIIKPFLDQFP